MTILLQRNPIADPPQADELRSEALHVVEPLHEAIKSWAPEFEYTPTDASAEFPCSSADARGTVRVASGSA